MWQQWAKRQEKTNSEKAVNHRKDNINTWIARYVSYNLMTKEEGSSLSELGEGSLKDIELCETLLKVRREEYYKEKRRQWKK